MVKTLNTYLLVFEYQPDLEFVSEEETEIKLEAGAPLMEVPLKDQEVPLGERVELSVVVTADAMTKVSEVNVMLMWMHGYVDVC